LPEAASDLRDAADVLDAVAAASRNSRNQPGEAMQVTFKLPAVFDISFKQRGDRVIATCAAVDGLLGEGATPQEACEHLAQLMRPLSASMSIGFTHEGTTVLNFAAETATV